MTSNRMNRARTDRARITPAQRARSNRRRDSRNAVLILAGLAVAIAGVGTFVLTGQAPRLDDVTLCPVDRPLDSSTIVLVDTTDALNRTQSRRLLAAVSDAQADIPTHGRLTLLLLDADNPYEPRELVSVCNPGAAADANPLTQTVSRIEARWRRSFEDPIRKAAEALARAEPAPRSPILETIAGLTLRPDFDRRVPDRRLVIVSDMLQHTPGSFSHYAAGPLWPQFERSSLARDAAADLTGVAVAIEYLRRPEHGRFQGQHHHGFWNDWFTRAGAKSLNTYGAPKQNNGMLLQATHKTERR